MRGDGDDDGEVVVEEVDPTGDDAEWCLRRYFAELDQRFSTGFDPNAALPTDASTFLVARLDGRLLGCGALKASSGEAVEIKRMWVAPEARGRGVGRVLLEALEARATAAGYRLARLDSNGALSEAIAMYSRNGYVEVPPFNDEPHATHWFEKQLS
ncbi:MAG TPA: GNAT family N-acetyltransferase [Aquihabitans sp.]|nr:GNAT family N-acetyltransferase [Aquihabitans sp.]